MAHASPFVKARVTARLIFCPEVQMPRKKSNTYEEFVDKFRPKLTTDDCYTPPLVYDATRDWAVQEYRLQGREIVRPFYPGGDFEHYDYPVGCVVIDNPPFSILAKIKLFYVERGIDFFLFAPNLTALSSYSDGVNYVLTNANVIYENGADIKTSFVTSLGGDYIRTAPVLARAIDAAAKETAKQGKAELPLYCYPDCVISAVRINKIANKIDFRLAHKDCHFLRALASQKRAGKAIYGSGYLISELKAAELKAAGEVIVWALSDEERDIVKHLGV